MIYNVLDYGALGDGKTNDAPAIQKAIDDCCKAGGGQVYLPGGHTYFSGSLILRSNIDFHLEHGARLKASTNLSDYLEVESIYTKKSRKEPESNRPQDYTGEPRHFFITTWDCENVKISGSGIIDGSEEIFYGEISPYHIAGFYYPRIPVLLLQKIKALTICDVTLTGSAFWTVHLVGCNDVLIDGIRILNNLKMANCDGIDPDHCQNVRITNCHIECADDCIVLKNSHKHSEFGPCENIVVSNCTLISTSAAIKIGTESEDDFRNISVNNCTISNSNRGISLQLRDKGNIENVTFSNIQIQTRRFAPQWWGCGEPISITVLDRYAAKPSGTITNVHFENINCIGENGIFIYGSQKGKLQDISFRRIRVQLKKISRWPVDSWDLLPGENAGILHEKPNGFTCIRGENIRCEDVQIQCQDTIAPWYGKDFYQVDSDISILSQNIFQQ